MTNFGNDVDRSCDKIDILRRFTNRTSMAIALLILVGGCVQASPPAGSPQPSIAAPSAAAGDVGACFGGQLVAPNGENVDLTGTWQLSGNGPLYFVSQTGRCVSMAGGFPADQEMADLHRSPWGGTTVVFLGGMDENFVVTGRFAMVRQGGFIVGGAMDLGTQEWEVQFVDGRPTELRSVFTGDPEEGGSLTLTKLSDRFLEPLSP